MGVVVELYGSWYHIPAAGWLWMPGSSSVEAGSSVCGVWSLHSLPFSLCGGLGGARALQAVSIVLQERVLSWYTPLG